MSQAQATASVTRILLAPDIDIEEFLSLPHLVRQSKAERQELESALQDFPSRASGLSDANLREQAARWALGQKPEGLGRSNHPLALMIHGRVAEGDGDLDKALSCYEKAAEAAPTESVCVLSRVRALCSQGRAREALDLLDQLRDEFSDRGEFSYQEGRALDALGRHDEAAQSYEQAIKLNPEHYRAVFQLARLLDLRGDDQAALELYRRIGPGSKHAFVSACLNMALIHEDRGEYDNAISCCRSVLKVDPNSHRARLFLGDTEASGRMYYSPEEAKETERLEAVLRVPVTDFELSVRSRNCLAKMNIHTLGDLVRQGEQELLSYKNFGETSLREIKEMLADRGLRLGMLKEDGQPRPAVQDRPRAPMPATSHENTPIDELELSVRSRKCMDRLGIQTIGQLCAKSEKELASAKNFGKVSLQEIKAKLGERGLSLRPE